MNLWHQSLSTIFLYIFLQLLALNEKTSNIITITHIQVKGYEQTQTQILWHWLFLTSYGFLSRDVTFYKRLDLNDFHLDDN